MINSVSRIKDQEYVREANASRIACLEGSVEHEDLDLGGLSMATTIIRNVQIITDHLIPNGVLTLNDDTITFVGSAAEYHRQPIQSNYVLEIDADGGYAAPGLIDVHIHGANGHDVLEGTDEALRAIGCYCAAGGTTGFLPTTVTAAPAKTRQAAQAVQAFTAQQAKGSPSGARVLGMHLEGPYLNIERKGAQFGAAIRPVDLDELQELYLALGDIWKLMTIAPEIPGAQDAIRWLVQRGITASAGHSTATFAQSVEAFDWGISQATHIFNGMHPLHHREPGLLGACLTKPTIACQLVADGVHVHPAAVELLYRMVGCERIILITDAVQAAGLHDGSYVLGDLAIVVRQGTAWLPDGTLAGSTLTMLDAVRNVIDFLQIPLVNAFRMGSLNPAQSLGLNRTGWLRAGYAADVLLLSPELELQRTIVGGQTVFSASA